MGSQPTPVAERESGGNSGVSRTKPFLKQPYIIPGCAENGGAKGSEPKV